MEDFKFLFYIVLAILYFIITNFRKFKKKQETEATSPEAPTVSFEEILKQHLPKKEATDSKTKSRDKLFPEMVPDKKYKLERTNLKPISLENREDAAEARRRAAAREHLKRPNEKSRPKNSSHPIAALLRNPESARTAIILSEVLKRKEY